MNDLICIENKQPMIRKNIAMAIVDIEKRIKELETIRKQYKDAFLKIMPDFDCRTIKDDDLGLTITYTPETKNKDKFHEKEFKNDYPELYTKYCKMDGSRSASVTIRVK